MRPSVMLLCCTTGLSLSGGTLSQTTDIDIPYEEFYLDNGLRVIVHEDRKAPIVAVTLWYHVGSRNENPGKTGFAHLFEHLMFNGSENHDAEYFEPLEQVGVTGINGTTNNDRTNYFQTVPSSALDLALWLESDRMGHLLGAIDQEKLDEQRGVVQNEKRQGENQPYGKAFTYITENVFPEGHPYSWSVIGSMEDLNAASLDDVHEWFRTYYGPNNATLVLAGDIDIETARDSVQRHFGAIPPGPPLARMEAWVPTLEHDRRMVTEDRVRQARIYRTWPIPEWGSAELDLMSLANGVLTGGQTSRLYQRLVYEDQIATDAGGFIFQGEISGAYILWATAQPGQDLAAVEETLDEELQRFLKDGPTDRELSRVIAQSRSSFVRGVERVGGFSGKSGILAESAVFGGRPDAYKDSLALLDTAKPEDLRNVAENWLAKGSFILEVHPYNDRMAASGDDADRSALPMPESYPGARFPNLERAELTNGMQLIVARRDAVPVVNFNLQLDAGYAADQFGAPGTAALAMTLLDQGTTTRGALEISEELAQLGARLSAGSNLDFSSVSLSALKENLAASLDIYSDVILNPAFSEEELERQRRLRLSQIQREKSEPVSMALRIFPALIYGDDHAYALPMTGSGTEESVSAITRDDLVAYHDTWFKPNNATMIVVGDTTLEEIAPMLGSLFADWSPGEVPEKNIPTVELQEESRIILVDRPGSEQSIIFGGQLVFDRSDEREMALRAANEAFGGAFTSRINMNLREDKAWSYGVRSMLVDTQSQRPFIVYAPVQTDRTADSLVELDREIRELLDQRPVDRDEIATFARRNTLTLPGRWETASAVAGDIAELVRFGLPDDYWDHYAGLVEGVTVEDANAAVQAELRPDRLVWVVVGDLEAIEESVRALNLGRVDFMDVDGNLL
ncbi:MAG: pitrilysin family protein [Rhodospirillaceae bacterium]|nr:pitrilysin family protein [Rhodospirillaceae bacterium]